MLVKTCERCDAEMKYVPAGFSRAKNRPYPAFWSCDKRAGGCGATARAEAGAMPVGRDAGEARLAAMEAKLDEILAVLKRGAEGA